MLVVGAGIVGLCCAWLLQRSGHRVLLVDPSPDPCAAGTDQARGSSAALGVLMARVFHRNRGRAWLLRQRSLELWQHWLPLLEQQGLELPRRRGLLWLAEDEEQLTRLQRLVVERQAMGLPLEWWDRDRLDALEPCLPAAARGGLLSPEDGQLDPGAAMTALLDDARRAGLQCLMSRVTAIRRKDHHHWRLLGDRGETLADSPWLVLTAGLACSTLLQDLGHRLPLSPVLGQALELRLTTPPAWTWPGVVVWRGQNLVPRPDRPGGRDLWLGATLEPGEQADADQLAVLRRWSDAGLGWLERAQVVRHWQGYRARPVGRPAPLLEQLEPGLLLAGGHYRNGVLLAPASAEWVRARVEQEASPR